MKAWLATDGLAEAHSGTIKPRAASNFSAPIEITSRLKTLDTAALGYLQRTAGNASVSMMLARLPGRASAAVQRCGPKPCSCSPEEQAAHAAEEQGAGGAATVQRTSGDGHDLCAPRFAGDIDLEGSYDDEVRLTMGGRGKAGTRKVDRGPAVAAVQQALADLGLLSSRSVTGRYNQATWDAVAHLKRKESLGWGSMGDVGPRTMDHLNKKFMPPCPRPSPPCPPCAPEECPPCPAPGEHDSARPETCPPCPHAPACGPDATDWFVRQVNAAMSDPAVLAVKASLTNADRAAALIGTTAAEIAEGGATAALLRQERALGGRAPARDPTISGQVAAGTASGTRAGASTAAAASNPLLAPAAVTAVALVGTAALQWKSLVDHGARYDFKAHADSMNHPHSTGCPDDGCPPGEVGIITLCPGTNPENCYESDLPGNLFYALIGRFVGWSELTMQLGSQFAELTDVTPRPSRPAVTWDSPEDTAAISLGFGLPLPLSLASLCASIPPARARLDARTGCEDCTTPTAASIH